MYLTSVLERTLSPNNSPFPKDLASKRPIDADEENAASLKENQNHQKKKKWLDEIQNSRTHTNKQTIYVNITTIYLLEPK